MVSDNLDPMHASHDGSVAITGIGGRSLSVPFANCVNLDVVKYMLLVDLITLLGVLLILFPTIVWNIFSSFAPFKTFLFR